MNILNRSALRTNNGLPYFEIPEIAGLGWVRHGFLTRNGGVSPSPYDTLNVGKNSGDLFENVSKNRDLISIAFDLGRSRLILLRQRHQDRILVLKKSFHALPSRSEFDAMITDKPNFFLGIQTADCIPILVVDQKQRVIAAIHAGRSGTALLIMSKVLKTMRDEFGCSMGDLQIAMGPSIGSCCYEIDERVFQPEWKPFSASAGSRKWMVDLARINIRQMEEEGVSQAQIVRIDLCTRCNSDLFFSYRKEGRTGR